MQFRMFTHNGFKIAVPVLGVRLVEQDPDSPTHSIIHLELDDKHVFDISVDEDFFVVISRLNTLAD